MVGHRSLAAAPEWIRTATEFSSVWSVVAARQGSPIILVSFANLIIMTLRSGHRMNNTRPGLLEMSGWDFLWAGDVESETQFRLEIHNFSRVKERVTRDLALHHFECTWEFSKKKFQCPSAQMDKPWQRMDRLLRSTYHTLRFVNSAL